MNYGAIKWSDDVNGDNMSLSIFVSGCSFNCPSCFNKDAQNREYGNEFSEDIKNKILDYFEKNNKYIHSLSWLGGEPLAEYNYSEVLSFTKSFKERFPNKTIWLWSGMNFEFILNNRKEILNYVDVLCDGLFIEELKNSNLKYIGSSNQNVIDVKTSIKENKITLYYNQKKEL